MNQTKRKLLLIFVKNPVPGQVKTRLAASIGPHHAAEVYRELLNYTRKAVLATGSGIKKQVWYAGEPPPDDMWPPGHFQLRQQPDGSLGEKMAAAFKAGFDSGFEKIVIIGSDCEQVKETHIRQAFDRLQQNSVVLGPSKDGGYYLLGINRWLPWLFENKPWSTKALYQKTLETIRQHKLTHTELEVLNDIDTLEDLENSSLDLIKSAE